jgi:hypothetical protein
MYIAQANGSVRKIVSDFIYLDGFDD